MTKILTVTPALYTKIYNGKGEVEGIDITEAKTEVIELTEEQSTAFETERQAAHQQFLIANTRSRRDVLLKESDLLMLVDRWEKFSQDEQNYIKQYRQLLRDLPGQEGFPFDVTFPEKP